MPPARPTAQPAEIRALTAEDVPAYRALRLEMVAQHPSAFLTTAEAVAALTDADLAARIAAPPRSVAFGALTGGQLVAVAGFFARQGAKTAHKGIVWGVYVAPAHRRQGLATATLRALLAHAGALVRIVYLAAEADNAAAVALYRRLGFTPWGREPMAMQIDGTFHDEIHMALPLDPAAKDTPRA